MTEEQNIHAVDGHADQMFDLQADNLLSVRIAINLIILSPTGRDVVHI